MSEQPFSYTNTSLATARRCLTEFDLRYLQRLERDGEERESLQVGQAWHRAFFVQHQGGDPYAELTKRAPSPLWAEKLRRLFAAYAWYWAEQPLELVEAEATFHVQHADDFYSGQRDGVVALADGRRGVLERKTTSDSVEAGSAYWDRLALDVQVGLYAVTMDPLPSFILYDVVRKPTINPKNIAAKDASRLRAELTKSGRAGYYGEAFGPEVVEEALGLGRETVPLYGARLTADIGERPDFYFARREVPRTTADYATLLESLTAQVRVVEFAEADGLLHRNPDACNVFGQCDFFRLCSNNIRPRAGQPPPEGFRRRAHLHPELVPDPE